MVDLTTRIGSLTLANPVMPASGTFGPELAQVFDLDALGALVTKSVTPDYRAGNPLPRLCETEAGVLNSIGIPGKGLDHFIASGAGMARFRAPLVVSLSAPTVAFANAASAPRATPGVAAIEANISCPNLEEDGGPRLRDARDAAAADRAMRGARGRAAARVKLSPNTGDIAAVRGAAGRGGGCGGGGEHHPRPRDRHRDGATEARQRDGRVLGAGLQADRAAAGLAMRAGGAHPRGRRGRHRDGRGCGGIPDGRRRRRAGRHRELRQPDRDACRCWTGCAPIARGRGSGVWRS
jgi:hypothetical protein